MKKVMFPSFRRVFGLLGKHKASFSIAVLICATMEPAYQIGYSFAYKYIVNSIEFKNIALLINSVSALLMIIVIFNIVQPITGYYFEREVYKPTIAIERSLLKNIMMLPMSFFTKAHSADILSRITNDLGTVSSFFKENCYDVASQFVLGIGSFVSFAMLDIRLLPVSIIFGLLSLFMNTRFKERFLQLNQKLQEQIGKTNEIISDLVGGLPIVKLFCSEKAFQDKYEYAYLKVVHCNDILNRTTIKKNTIDSLISAFSFFVTLVVGMAFYLQNTLTLGDLSALLIIQGNVVNLFVNLGVYINHYKGSLAGAQRIFEFLDMEAEDRSYYNPIMERTCSSEEGIVLEHVNFRYDAEKQTLQDINMHFDWNALTAIVGMSGSGKTTLLKLLLKFYQPDQGSIRFFGRDIKGLGVNELRSMIAYIEQTPALFYDTIYQNICCGLDGVPLEEVIQAAQKAGAHKFISELPEQYNTIIGPKGIQLSGGQLQRIAIARAIVKNSPIIILDEPTSALDHEAESTILSFIKSNLQDHIFILVAHRMTNIVGADYIYFIEEGKIIEEGSYSQLVERRGKLFHLQSMFSAVNPKS